MTTEAPVMDFSDVFYVFDLAQKLILADCIFNWLK